MQPSRPPRRAPLAAAVCAALVTIAATALLAGGPAAPASAHAQSSKAAKKSPRAKTAAALPDSVLARVGTSRTVTVSDFREAWDKVQPPARPERLTPETAREFLDLLIGKEALGEAALKLNWTFTAEESARVAALRDRLMMQAALDSALAETRAAFAARGIDTLSTAELGTAARDALVERMNVQYDEALVERLAAAWAAIPKPPSDSGVFAALRALGREPEIATADLPRIVARTASLEYRTTDLLSYWRRLNPLGRPRIGLASQVKELIGNGLFEERLRADALARGLDRSPAIEAEVAREQEFIAVTHLVSRDVYEKIPVDSVTLAKYYLEHEDAWHLPVRVRVLRLVFDDRAVAADMVVKLREASMVDSLVKRAQAVGLSYEAEYSAETDSALFARAMQLGTGAVLGPDSTDRGWAATRVQAIVPGRARPFSEVRELVRKAVNGEEGERLMQALLDRVRRETRVQVNDVAVRRLGGA